MALVNVPVFIQNPKAGPVSFSNSDSANTKKTLVTSDADGTKVVGIIATSTDTSSRVAQLWLTRSATSYLLGSVAVPTLSGTDGVNPTVNLLNTTDLPGLPVDNDGQPYFLLESGDTLQVSFTAQITAAKNAYVTAVFGNF